MLVIFNPMYQFLTVLLLKKLRSRKRHALQFVHGVLRTPLLLVKKLPQRARIPPFCRTGESLLPRRALLWRDQLLKSTTTKV